MSTTTAARRPVIVTIGLVFVYLGGLADTALGILVLLSRYQVPDDEVLYVSLLGAGVILFGLLTLAVASAVGRGSRLARLLLTAYLVVQFGLHLWTIAGTDWDPMVIALTVVDAFILVSLWAPPGSRHFRRAA